MRGSHCRRGSWAGFVLIWGRGSRDRPIGLDWVTHPWGWATSCNAFSTGRSKRGGCQGKQVVKENWPVQGWFHSRSPHQTGIFVNLFLKIERKEVHNRPGNRLLGRVWNPPHWRVLGTGWTNTCWVGLR